MFFLAESHNTGDSTPYLLAEGARMRELQQAGIVETVFLKAIDLARSSCCAPPTRRPRATPSAACR